MGGSADDNGDAAASAAGDNAASGEQKGDGPEMGGGEEEAEKGEMLSQFLKSKSCKSQYRVTSGARAPRLG